MFVSRRIKSPFRILDKPPFVKNWHKVISTEKREFIKNEQTADVRGVGERGSEHLF